MRTPILVAFFFFLVVIGAPVFAGSASESTIDSTPPCNSDGYPLPEQATEWLVDLWITKQVEWLEGCYETAGGPITNEQLVRAEILREEYGEQLYLISMRFGMHETARELRQNLLETGFSMDSLAQVYCQGFYKIPRVFRWWFVYEYSPCWECLVEEPAETE